MFLKKKLWEYVRLSIYFHFESIIIKIMKNKKLIYWRITWISALIVALITFTPLVTPQGEYAPMVLGLPRTMWAGILVAVVLVVLTLVASYVHPNDQQNKEEK